MKVLFIRLNNDLMIQKSFYLTNCYSCHIKLIKLQIISPGYTGRANIDTKL